MKFHLDFDIKKLSPPVNHKHKLLLIGSCFTENIGEKLHRNKLSVLENPNGILFNPVSVAEAIISYVENKRLDKPDFFEFNEAWHSWKHHSRFSGLSVSEAMNKVNESTNRANQFLQAANYLMITLGSSWIYLLTEKAAQYKKDLVVANNHKAPAEWFYKRLMKPDEVVLQLNIVLKKLFEFNPSIKIIFTISPVRHLREGVIENNRSKAVLIQAVHQLVNANENLYYFPAYELVIDDLRDYRFYSEDLVHPNYFATQYVWEKFVGSCLSDESKKIIEELKSVNLALAHKPFNSSSGQHLKFLQGFYEKTKILQEKYSYLDFTKELQFFLSGMS